MHTATSLPQLAAMLGSQARLAVAVGVFDGVHLGHQAILTALHAAAARHDSVPVVVTFEPHPRAILQHEETPRLLTVREQKLAILAEFGVAAIVFLPFSEQMAILPPGAFVRTYLAPQPGLVAAVCVGAPWRFGNHGQGDVASLAGYGREFGFEVVSVAPLQLDDRPVSSTRIRQAVQAGDLNQAERLLGRPYRVYGHVSHGRGLGRRQMNCPTANLADPNILLPRCGVYAARAIVDPTADHCQDQYSGIAYIGSAPTVAHARGETPGPNIIEMHLFNFSDSIYGHKVEIEFAAFLRAEQDFAQVDDLRRQIQRDIAAARAALGLALTE